jgi:hypothetical protein
VGDGDQVREHQAGIIPRLGHSINSVIGIHPHAAKARSGWDRYPSLRLGPAASSRRGRIQRGIQRAFMVSGTGTLPAT